MEEGQRHLATKLIQQLVMRLNPCCNGRGSKTFPNEIGASIINRLNPCCNGRGSKTTKKLCLTESSSLNPCCNGRGSKTAKNIKC